MTDMRPVPVVSSHFLLPLLCWLLLCPLITGCYVDASSGTPDMVSQRLGELLGDPDSDVRLTAAEALGKIGHASANSLLITALNDGNARVRAAAALSLGRLGERESGLVLAMHLADSAEAVRAASALALGDIEPSGASEVRILKVLHHSETSARIAASRALLSLDTVSFSVDLVGALRDSDASVRQGVAAALGETGDARAVPHLEALLRTDVAPGVRSEAAFRLGKLGTSRILDELSTVAASDPDIVVRGWARWAAQQITPSREFGSERRLNQ